MAKAFIHLQCHIRIHFLQDVFCGIYALYRHMKIRIACPNENRCLSKIALVVVVVDCFSYYTSNNGCCTTESLRMPRDKFQSKTGPLRKAEEIEILWFDTSAEGGLYCLTYNVNSVT